MKRKILLLLFLFSAFFLSGQEIKLNSATVASAGSNSEFNTVNISKWRVGEVHLIILKHDEFNESSEINWNVSSYPNPFRESLNLYFKIEETAEFTIQVTDITGKKQWFSDKKSIIPNQIISLDLATLTPAMYLVTITPKDNHTQRIMKVQKH